MFEGGLVEMTPGLSEGVAPWAREALVYSFAGFAYTLTNDSAENEFGRLEEVTRHSPCPPLALPQRSPQMVARSATRLALP